MAKLFSSLLTTLYWPVVGLFGIAAVVFVIAFVSTIERSATGSFYNVNAAGSAVFIALMLAASIIMKQRGNLYWAHLILYAPFGLVLLTVVLFFAMAFAFGKGR
jgi:hypothetical protein